MQLLLNGLQTLLKVLLDITHVDELVRTLPQSRNSLHFGSIGWTYQLATPLKK